jgi:hypothetical protein
LWTKFCRPAAQAAFEVHRLIGFSSGANFLNPAQERFQAESSTKSDEFAPFRKIREQILLAID